MKFRTEIERKTERGKDEMGEGLRLRPERPMVLTGSCFADYMGERMRSCLWDARNPFGVLFNPLSIAEALRIALLSEEPEADYNQSIFETDDDLFLSWLADSNVWSDEPDVVLIQLMQQRQAARNLLSQGQTLCVTFGTAYCYFLAADPKRVVANCHKQPQSNFVRRRVSQTDICNIWTPLLEKLKRLYPNLQIIFTVSPVRHVRDGLHENTLSKAILHLAIDNLCEHFDFCHYFPAYESLIDDLRDYRFYADDLVHPSAMAVEYIWELFKSRYIDASGEEMLKKGEAIAKRAAHRHIIPDSPAAEDFKRKTREMYDKFSKEYPGALKLRLPI